MKKIVPRFLTVFVGTILGAQAAAQGFVLSSSPVAGNSLTAIVTADVNGDRKPDLIAANYFAKTIIIWTNDGYGNMVSNATLTTHQCVPEALTATDVNGDHLIDLVCYCYNSSIMLVFTNNGFGGLVQAGQPYLQNVNTPTLWVAGVDVNGDGMPDLICSGSNGPSMILTNAGNGLFAVGPLLPSANYGWYGTVLDVNRDGRPDIIDFTWLSSSVSLMRVLTNNGDSTFSLSSTNIMPPSWNWFGNVTSIDINGNGNSAIAVANYSSGAGKQILVMTNNGFGVFGSNSVYTVGKGANGVLAADINGDGKPDLVIGSSENMTVLTNNGTGSFNLFSTITPPRSFTAANYPLAIADISGDGRLDLTA